jgi:serine phosphatase RsbU (regulator of sigma subunit)
VPVTLESGPVEPITEMYQAEASEKGIPVRLLLAPDTGKTDRGFLGLIACVIALVIGVGAIVSVAVARKVTKPLEGLVDDVRHIARGNLGHRISVRGAREIVLLGKSIDRMASSLQESQDAEIELSAREREMEVAGEVREALVPEKTPQVEGYWVGGLQDSCAEPGGDFYDFVEREDGKLGLLLCEVSGKGVPGALIAATARAYLRTILSSASDVNEGLRLVNRFFAPDVRRGMYVTSLYVLLDPSEHSAEVACAGHQVPLLSYTAADRKLRKIQPEGIALGFDKGPIFERTLQTSKVDLAPGDRLVLSNAGPLLVQNEAGEEFGEQSFFRGVMKRSALPGDEFLSDLDFAFETFADGEPYPSDISILTVQRNA